MPNREDILREKTHKGGTDSLSQRVYYTLTGEKGLESHRTIKALALLMEHLHQEDVLSDDVVDEILLESVTG